MRSENIHKILFITLTNIGDVILTLPVLAELRRVFPSAKIDVIVGPRPKEVFEKDPRVNEIFVYDKHSSLGDKIKLIKKLRGRRYDLAIDMRGSLFPFLAGARKGTALLKRKTGKSRHKRFIHLSKLNSIGLEPVNGAGIYIDNKSKEDIKNILEKNGIRDGDKLIGVSPWSRGTLKEWYREGIVSVIKGVEEMGHYKIVLIGDEGAGRQAAEIRDSVSAGNVIDLTGKTGLRQLFALIERLELLLTCDSANLHIASDLGIRTVALFGPTDSEEYGPLAAGSVVIRKELGCSPCKKAVCAPGHHECMRGITSEEVLEAIRKIL
ncbi:MAG: glycosyltransferase family 9 protein [Candidatus Omnitrophota bacterium]